MRNSSRFAAAFVAAFLVAGPAALSGLALPGLEGAAAPLADPGFPRIADPVRARLRAAADGLEPGGSVEVFVELDIDPAWHIYGPTTGELGLPTTISWELPPGFSASPIDWPKTEVFSLAGVESQGYSGKLSLGSTITAPKDLAPGGTATIRARVEWLACRVECQPGQASLRLSLPVAGGGKLWLALVLAFLGGLILNLMPCVLPVVSLKAMALSKAGRDGGEAPLREGLSYSAGVLVSFWAIAGALLALRSGGRALGWGFQLQDPAFVALTALVFFVMGLELFGVFEFGAVFSRLGAIGSGRRRAGSFLMGLFATVVATPCTAPFMGVALGYALSHNAVSALAVFTAMGLGLAAPVLAVSGLPALGRLIPKSGAWTGTFRRLLGFPMMAAVVWLAYVLAGQRGGGALPGLLAALLASALGAWIWGAWGGWERKRPVRAAAAAAALGLVALSVALALSAVRGEASNGVQAAPEPVGLAAPAKQAEPSADGFWRPWSREAVAESRKRGLPVFVDYSARWCLSCKVNEAFALDNPAVRERFSQLGVATYKADWTNRDASIAASLEELGRAGVPLYALYLPGKEAPLLLPELLSPAIVLRYLNSVTNLR